jgi:hypothetical protein
MAAFVFALVAQYRHRIQTDFIDNIIDNFRIVCEIIAIQAQAVLDICPFGSMWIACGSDV